MGDIGKGVFLVLGMVTLKDTDRTLRLNLWNLIFLKAIMIINNRALSLQVWGPWFRHPKETKKNKEDQEESSKAGTHALY